MIISVKPPNADFDGSDPAKDVDHMCAKDHFAYCDNYIIQLRNFPWTPPKATNQTPKPGASLGELDILPLEILHQVLSFLDFEALDAVRAINSKTKSIVESLKPYRQIMKYAKTAIRALYKTRTSSLFSATHLYEILSDEKCVACSSFGHYLFLLSGDRCCFWCLYNDSRFASMTLSSAKSEFKISDTILRSSCNVLHSIPGNYVPHYLYPPPPPDRASRKKTEIVSTHEVQKFSLTIASLKKPERRSTRVLPRTTETFQLPSASIFDNKAPPYRGMAACSFPYINPQTEQWAHVVWCRGCALKFEKCEGVAQGFFRGPPMTDEFKSEYFRLRRDRERAYTDEAFLAHFQECESAQKVWKFQVDCVRRGLRGQVVDWGNFV